MIESSMPNVTAARQSPLKSALVIDVRLTLGVSSKSVKAASAT
jgi:hypothetical protein